MHVKKTAIYCILATLPLRALEAHTPICCTWLLCQHIVQLVAPKHCYGLQISYLAIPQRKSSVKNGVKNAWSEQSNRRRGEGRIRM